MQVNKLLHIISIFCLSLFFQNTVFCQISESEIKIQAIFIKANQEKLLGNYETAAEGFGEVLKKDPTNDVAAYEYARCMAYLERWEESIKYANKAIELGPEFDIYKLFIADIYQENNQDIKAAEIYEKLVKSEPNNENYYLKWAFYLVRSSEPEKALKVYNLLEKKSGINEELTRRKHTIYLGMGDYKKATQELEQLIDAFPKNMSYRLKLAGFYEKMGNLKKAETVYQEILELDPGNSEAQLALSGNIKKPNNELEFLASLAPIFSNPEVDIDLKVKEIMPVLEKLPDVEDSELSLACLQLSSILEETHPQDPKPYAISGDVLFYMGRMVEAQEKYRQTIQISNKVFLVWDQYLQTFVSLKDYKGLLLQTERAITLFPNQASLYYYEGISFHETGKYKYAYDDFQQAIMMAGSNKALKTDIYHYMAKTLIGLKDFGKSDYAFEQSIALNPNKPEVLADYSMSLANRSLYLDKSEKLARNAYSLSPENAQVNDAMGWVLFKKGEFKKADPFLMKAAELSNNKNAVILEHLGDNYFQMGMVDKAVSHWQKALVLGGDTNRLNRKISSKQLN